MPTTPNQPDLHAPDIDTALPLFRRPFAPEAVKFKVQSKYGDGGALAVAYIDRRLVIERLNLIVGGHWQETYEAVRDGGGKTVAMWCYLTVFEQQHVDVGSGYQGKGLVSDALKRAAVNFGIGVSIYASPSIVLKADGSEVRAVARQGKQPTFYLQTAGEKKCREVYATWLEEHGKSDFGEPILHGDVEGAAGADEQEQDLEGEVEGATTAAMPLVDNLADELRNRCRRYYTIVKKAKSGRTKLPPARFQEELTKRSVSHDALAEYGDELVKLGTELGVDVLAVDLADAEALAAARG